MEKENAFYRLKPGVPKRWLLFMAAFAWTFAGLMLTYRGLAQWPQAGRLPWLKVLGGLAGGGVFYLLMFARISRRHAKRIVELEIDRPCLFSFFDLKSYLLMGIMTTLGVLLRKSGWVPPPYLMTGYLVMGLPLFLSSFRFYRAAISFPGNVN